MVCSRFTVAVLTRRRTDCRLFGSYETDVGVMFCRSFSLLPLGFVAVLIVTVLAATKLVWCRRYRLAPFRLSHRICVIFLVCDRPCKCILLCHSPDGDIGCTLTALNPQNLYYSIDNERYRRTLKI